MKRFGEKQIYSLPTPHTRSGGNNELLQSGFWLLDGTLDLAGMDFHIKFLIRGLEGLRSFKNLNLRINNERLKVVGEFLVWF